MAGCHRGWLGRRVSYPNDRFRPIGGARSGQSICGVRSRGGAAAPRFDEIVDDREVHLGRLLPRRPRARSRPCASTAASRASGSSAKAAIAAAIAAASPGSYVATVPGGKVRSTIGSRDATTGLPIAAYS